jgi:hypothetical protein
MMPDSLLQDPCKAVGAGETVGSLAKGYVKNTSCIGAYRALLERQRKFKKRQEELYNGNTN